MKVDDGLQNRNMSENWEKKRPKSHFFLVGANMLKVIDQPETRRRVFPSFEVQTAVPPLGRSLGLDFTQEDPVFLLFPFFYFESCPGELHVQVKKREYK